MQRTYCVVRPDFSCNTWDGIYRDEVARSCNAEIVLNSIVPFQVKLCFIILNSIGPILCEFVITTVILLQSFISSHHLFRDVSFANSLLYIRTFALLDVSNLPNFGYL